MHFKAQRTAARCLRWMGILALAVGVGFSGSVMAAGKEAAKPAKVDASDTVLIKKATEDTKSTAHLAGIHAQKMKMDCQACHGATLIPNDNASDVNANCVKCHGGYDKLAPETAKKSKNPDINVHASHLGPEVACTTCHRGHEVSSTYCTACHTNFDLPIPGGAAKK